MTGHDNEHDPGPEDLAPGWQASGFTVDGGLRQFSMFTSGLSRRQRGWRDRMLTAGLALFGLVVLVPSAIALVRWLVR